MNGTQRKILLTALLVFVLSELFPPWKYVDGETSAERPAGYHFIDSPPAPAPVEKMRRIFSIPDQAPPHHISVRVDKLRQELQRLFLTILMLGLLLVTIKRQTFVLRVSSIMLLLVAGGMALLLLYKSLKF